MKTNELPMPQRERAGIPILGIDTSTPDDLVEDGKCQELHNLRYKDSAWRPMHRFKLLHSISSMDVVYHHPISGRYIVREEIKGQVRYYAYDLSTPNPVPITLLGALDKVPEGTLINISHFGNVLTLSAPYFSASFIWSDGTYVRTEIDRYTPSVEFSFSYTDEVAYKPLALQVDTGFTFTHGNKPIILSPNKWYTYTDDLMTYIRSAGASRSIRFLWVLKDEKYNNGELNVPSTQRDLYWSGEHAFFAALRMHDGSVCNLSPVLLNISQNNFGHLNYSVIDNITGIEDPLLGYTTHLLEKPLVLTTEFLSVSRLPDDITSVYSPMRYGVGEYTVSIEEDVDATLIDSVVLFSTRVYPTLSLHKIEHKSGGDMTDAYNDVALLNEPFYILEERRLSEMDRVKDKLSFSVEFDAEKAEDIISKTLYTPNIPHQLSGATTLDYNNRLHLANVTTTFTPSPLLNTSIMPTPQDVTTSLGVLIQHGFNKYPLWGSVQTGVELYPGNNLVLSYHDYRVSKFLAHVTDADASGPHTYSFAAKAATGNNMAYMVMPPTKLYKYPPIGLLNGEEAQYTPTEGSISITESNRIQVSQANNPFSFPFNLSYAVGSANNTILALQSAALEFPDEKRGDLPLFVFTEEGVFALRAGDNTLYARVDPINHDKIINPNTLAVNNMVVYITEEGIKLLSGSTATIISSPISGVEHFLYPAFLKTCKMVWIKAHNEIMFFMDGDNIALIYNLENGFWCSRDIEGSKINTDELVSGRGIYSMEEDDSQPLGCLLVTRPIKLGSLGFKRLETIIPRVSPMSNGWFIDVVGALSPALSWRLLKTIEANKNRPVIIRRTPFSAKYFQIRLEIPGDNRFYISNIDVEYYHRFRHRLR